MGRHALPKRDLPASLCHFLADVAQEFAVALDDLASLEHASPHAHRAKHGVSCKSQHPGRADRAGVKLIQSALFQKSSDRRIPAGKPVADALQRGTQRGRWHCLDFPAKLDGLQELLRGFLRNQVRELDGLRAQSLNLRRRRCRCLRGPGRYRPVFRRDLPGAPRALAEHLVAGRLEAGSE